MAELDATAIEWDKYNMMERIVFWCFLNYHITGPILLIVVTIIMLINCNIAHSLLRAKQEVGFDFSFSALGEKRNQKERRKTVL